MSGFIRPGQSNPTLRTFGFSLDVDAFARGGTWKDKSWGFCSDSHDVTGSSMAQAEGRLDLFFNATGAVNSDRLIIRVTGQGAPQAKIVLKDIAGKTLPLSALTNGRGLVADLPQPGAYTLTASINAQAAQIGRRGDVHTLSDMAISVQSLRDALQLGTGAVPGPDSRFPIDIRIPISLLEAELKKQLFKDGQYFPCKPENGCNDATDVYLETPLLQIKNGWVLLTMHLNGRIALIIPIDGDVLSYGTPDVKQISDDGVSHDYLIIEGLSIDIETRNDLIRYLRDRFVDRLEETLRAKARVNLTPQYERALAKLRDIFPMHLGDSETCMDLDMKDLRLQNLRPDEATQTLTARLLVGISLVDLKVCDKHTIRTQTEFPIREMLRGGGRPLLEPIQF